MMQQGLDIHQEERPWGNFRQFTKNCPTTVKILTIDPGESLSRQSHEHRSEFWRIIAGKGTVEIEGKSREAVPGDEFTVQEGGSHRIACLGDSPTPLQILEISFGSFDEDDITRSEDKYGRK